MSMKGACAQFSPSSNSPASTGVNPACSHGFLLFREGESEAGDDLKRRIEAISRHEREVNASGS
jgi:hypothetical protein